MPTPAVKASFFGIERRLGALVGSLVLPAATGCIDPGLLGVDQQETDGGAESSGDEDAPNEDDSPFDRSDRDYPDAEDGTCNAWKYAYCDAIAACSAFVTREQCELDLGWLQCRTDAPLAECQDGIEAALDAEDCSALPVECGPGRIADRTLPTQLCEEIHEAMCEFRLFCGLEYSDSSCLETLSLTEPCEEFTSFLPTAVDCAEAYQSLACDDPIPRVCAGSLRY